MNGESTGPSGAAGFRPTGYRDLSEVGRGASGVVYRAWQIDFNRWVAIKVVTIGSGTTPLSQFRRERMAIGMLSGHPNIVTVHDGGITSDGTAYIVMEYLPDGTLASRLRQGPVPWPEAVTACIRVSGALESAHRAGVLHLDVKPENVFLSNDFDTVKLGDFGIASIRGSAATQTGMISGTLLHLAPELLRGEPPTPASDVYSLGSTVFTLVAGHPPFGRPGELDAVVMARLLGDRPAVPDLGAHGLPAPFCRVVEAALAPGPADRPATAGALGEQLRAAQTGAGLPLTPMLVSRAPVAVSSATLPPQPTPVDRSDDEPPAPAPPPAPPPGSAHRHRTMVATIAALLVLAAGAFAGLRSGSGPPGAGRRNAGTTVAAGPIPTAAAPPAGALTFRDDFSDPSSGWARDAGVADYDAGSYRMRIDGGPTRRIIGAPERNVTVRALADPTTSTRLEVDVTFVRADNLAGAGLYCRAQPDTRNRYQAVISPTGAWQITRDGRDDPIVKLASGDVALPRNGDRYRLGFTCTGPGPGATLRLDVGGVAVGEVVDRNGLAGGAVGMVVTTARAPGVEARFDDFVATTP